MNDYILKLTKRGFTPLEAYGLVRKLAIIDELEQWARTTPPMEAEEEQGWQSAKGRVLQISQRSQTPEDAAEAIRQIIDMVPHPQTARDRGRLRGLNEALDAISKGNYDNPTQFMEQAPSGGITPIPGHNPVPRQDTSDAWNPGAGSQIPRDYSMGPGRMAKKASREETIFLITPEGHTYTREGSESRSNHSLLASDFIFDNNSRDRSIAGIIDDDIIYGFPYPGVYREEWFTDEQIISLIELSREYNIDKLDIGTSDLKHLQGNIEMLIEFSLNPISEEDNLEEWYKFHLSYTDNPFYNYLLNSYKEDFNLNTLASYFLNPPLTPPTGSGNTIHHKFGSASPRPELGVSFNRTTFEYEPWVFDGPLEGGDCKFWIDSEGNQYWWRVVNMRPQHMELVFAIEKKGLPIELMIAGEWSDQRDSNGVEGSRGYPVLHTLDEKDEREMDLVRDAFSDWGAVVNWNRWLPLDGLEESEDLEKTADWEEEDLKENNYGTTKTTQDLTSVPPTFDMRSLFDLKKYVDLKGELINWDAFRVSSKSPDDDIRSLLEVLTEVGVAETADPNRIGGMFNINREKLNDVLQTDRKGNGRDD